LLTRKLAQNTQVSGKDKPKAGEPEMHIFDFLKQIPFEEGELDMERLPSPPRETGF